MRFKDRLARLYIIQEAGSNKLTTKTQTQGLLTDHVKTNVSMTGGIKANL